MSEHVGCPRQYVVGPNSAGVACTCPGAGRVSAMTEATRRSGMMTEWIMDGAKVTVGIDHGAPEGSRSVVVVSLHGDATPEMVQVIRNAYNLGCAWAEAEAVLPEGQRLAEVQFDLGEVEVSITITSDTHGIISDARWGDAVKGNGPTPAAALRALVEKLRERAG